MFETLKMAPPDPILGLTEAFNADPNPDKINLGVGVYKDASGNTPVLDCVKKAEARLLENEASKSYKPIPGDPAFGARVRELLLGAEHEVIAAGRAVSAHTPGGTGALRVAADYIHDHFAGATVWLTDPTWANHGNVFAHAGVATGKLAYFDAEHNAFACDAYLDALDSVAAGDVVLLHGCCHNPSGADPRLDEWRRIGERLAARGAMPLVDFAYQGFAAGLDEDAAGLRALLESHSEMIVASSFSKNFGLYSERVGGLSMVAADSARAEIVLSQMKAGIRANYSSPPAHGGAVVATVLGDETLRAAWIEELTAMRERINGMRHAFVEALRERGSNRDFTFIERQRGMFSFSGLDRDQVARLREEYSIYIVGSGRINVAGITPDNLPRLADAVIAVL